MRAAKKPIINTAQQRAATDPAQSIWVSANAGSGKTQVLVYRVIRLLLEGVRPDSILCITYTKAAAAEMADRLFGQLASWTAQTDQQLAETLSNLGADGADDEVLLRARKLFTLALETPGGLKIQTIHAFCERLLHFFPLEAGLAPGFTLLDDRASEELRAKALAEVVYRSGSTQDVASAFAQLNDLLNKDQFDELINAYMQSLRKAGPEVLALNVNSLFEILRAKLGLVSHVDIEEAQLKFATVDRDAYLRVANKLKGFASFHNLEVAAALKAIAVANDPTDALTAYFFINSGAIRSGGRLFSRDMEKADPVGTQFIRSESVRLAQLSEDLNLAQLLEANAQIFTIACETLRHIELTKQRTGKVDFDDLIRRAAQLLSTAEAREWVSFKLDPGLSHILLDESQDTGPDQWIIIDRLAEEFFAGAGRPHAGPRTLFVVGDEKQSIYRFLGADIQAFDAARSAYVGGKQLKQVNFDVSYRSTDEVLKAVDIVFLEQNEPAKIARAHTAHRKDAQGVVELWPLVMSPEQVDREPWQAPVDRPPQFSPRRMLARQIADKIKNWIDPQHPRKLSGRSQAVTPGDILILFSTRGPLFRMVMSELRAVGIPVAGADRLQLLNSLIVQDILGLLQWLLLPQDDHALACVLKSPLVPEPLSEEQLFNIANGRNELTLYQRLSGKNARWLAALAEKAVHLTPDELLSRILIDARLAIAARLGPEALEASDAMLDLARDHAADGASTLFGFVTWFQATETTLKRELAKAAGEVRLMTVHGAKGLEAPIVILADAAHDIYGSRNKPRVFDIEIAPKQTLPLWLVSGLNTQNATLEAIKEQSKDAQRAESGRQLYVAMTRAEDELYIAAVGQNNKSKAPEDSWWRKLEDKLGTAPQRFGPAEEFMPAIKPHELLQPPETPAWLTIAPSPELSAPRSGLTATVAGRNAYDAAAARQGRARHRLLQDLGDARPDQRLVLAKARAGRLGLSESEATRLAGALNRPELAPFLGTNSRAEVDISGILFDGRKVTGRLDRISERPEGLWLLDYKSGAAARPEHVAQMAGYVQLLEQAFPGRPVTAALFYTATANLQVLGPDQLTAALQQSDTPQT